MTINKFIYSLDLSSGDTYKEEIRILREIRTKVKGTSNIGLIFDSFYDLNCPQIITIEISEAGVKCRNEVSLNDMRQKMAIEDEEKK